MSLLLLSLILALCSFAGVTASAHSLRPAERQGRHTSDYLGGRTIVVSISQQWLNAYQNGHLVFSSPVLTGRPSLPTPMGVYHIFAKLHPATFHSPYSRNSKNYFPPTHINYALEWRAGGYFIHDSWWHTVYGAGTNGEHYDPTYGWQSGSHGCISMPLNGASWLYHWAHLGTTLVVRR